MIGDLIEEWEAFEKPFDEAKAEEIYVKSMNYELQVFTEADKKEGGQ